MTNGFSRRTMFKHSALLAAGAAATGLSSTQAAPAKGRAAAGPKALPFKISLAQWSLHKAIFEKQLDPLDFAKTANSFGIDAVEYVNQFFLDKAKDKKFLAELKTRAAGEGVANLLIMIDKEGPLGAADAATRKQSVEGYKKWVEAAAYLGCHSLRVNAAGDGSEDEQVKQTADGLRQLGEFADGYGLNVIVENHGGLSWNGAWLAKTLKAANHPRCGALPDFGNFRSKQGEEYDRYKGVEELMPFAKGVSAKSHDFDKKGNETQIDYLRMMKIVQNAGYRGYVGIEYEGKVLPEIEGILATKKLLEKVRAKLGATV